MEKYLQTVEQFQYVRRLMRQLIPTIKAMKDVYKRQILDNINKYTPWT